MKKLITENKIFSKKNKNKINLIMNYSYRDVVL